MNNQAVLHSVTQGEGEPIVLLHGWGMHSDCWGRFADELAKNHQVIKIDLPGHGKSEMVCSLTLTEITKQLLLQVPAKAHYIGWSLGGSVLMQMAAVAPERISSMTLIAASPCFVQQPNWMSAMQVDVLKDFAEALKQDYRKTLLQFIALQTLSSDQSKVALKQLRANVFSYGEPCSEALEQGLNILMNADLRDEFLTEIIPCLVVLGERDQLVPVAVNDFYNDKQCTVEIIPKAGHVPFLSHMNNTLSCVERFLADV